MLQVDGTFGQSTRRSGHPAKPVVSGVVALMLVGVIASPSPLVVLASCIVAICILICLWRPGQPPILLLPAFYQFMQVALKPYMTVFSGSSLQDLADFGENLEPAALFSLAAIAVLALGLRIGAGRARARNAAVDDWPFKQLLAVSIAAIIVGNVLGRYGEMFGTAKQIVLALSGIGSAGLFVLAYATMRLRRGLGWLAIVVASQIGIGMTGFFGGFQTTVLVLLCATLAAHSTLRARGIVLLALGAVLTLGLAVFWTSGKSQYRAFLSEGTDQQVVLQPLDKRVGYLVNKAAGFDSQQFAEGLTHLLARISYIDFLAVTMERVPAVIPHENGALLERGIWHVLTPRILFPDKPDLPSDTKVTARYTGLNAVVFADENTSISIGYLGELYIDFGIGGALLAVFLMSLAYGRCYRAIRDHSRTPSFVNYGLCMMLALAFAVFETALVKTIGSILTVAAVALLIQRLIWPLLIARNVSASISGRRSFGRGAKA
jgi:hypothetical protein